MNLTPQQRLAARAVMNAANPFGINGAWGMQHNVKHSIDYDFGYPSRDADLPFTLVYQMYQRNGFANALVDKTAGKTWQDYPSLVESEEDHDETGLEREIRRKFQKARIWQAMMEADKRSMVGKYAGLVLRVRDGLTMDKPVVSVRGGIDGLEEIIPAWEGQLVVSEWDTDPYSQTYGKPRMFQFNEQNVDPEHGKVRAFNIHPDRVIVWSEDGTTWGKSKLSAAYNALMDAEKIRGAGGEGFWKNAKSQPVISTNDNIDMHQVAQMLGTNLDGVSDKLSEIVAKWNKGFDVSLMLTGMDAKTLQVTLPSPEHFHNVALQEIAASWPIPQKILVGMQTGERASIEDQREWAQTNMSRRANETVPNIMAFVDRLVRFGILPDRDWYIDWSDLTAPTMAEKMDIAAKMAEINAKMAATGEPVFTDTEIRAIADYPALTDEQLSEMVDDTGQGGDDNGQPTGESG